MELDEARVLVAGATGTLGGLFARALGSEGARLALAGRNPERLRALAGELDVPALGFDARDSESCREAVDQAATQLGGLDAVFITFGLAGFGEASSLSEGATRELFEVNVLGPITMVRAALERLEPKGAIVGVSAIVADYPTAGMAAYSATKAAFSAYLSTVRRERRRQGLTVLDVRPQHMKTGFSDRAVEGDPPPLPDPIDPDAMVSAVLKAVRGGKREVVFDISAKELVIR